MLFHRHTHVSHIQVLSSNLLHLSIQVNVPSNVRIVTGIRSLTWIRSPTIITNSLLANESLLVLQVRRIADRITSNLVKVNPLNIDSRLSCSSWRVILSILFLLTRYPQRRAYFMMQSLHSYEKQSKLVFNELCQQ